VPSLAALKWLHSSVSAPVFFCALKHLHLLGKYSIASAQEAIDKAFIEEKFNAMVWKAREMGLAEPKFYQDD